MAAETVTREDRASASNYCKITWELSIHRIPVQGGEVPAYCLEDLRQQTTCRQNFNYPAFPAAEQITKIQVQIRKTKKYPQAHN